MTKGTIRVHREYTIEDCRYLVTSSEDYAWVVFRSFLDGGDTPYEEIIIHRDVAKNIARGIMLCVEECDNELRVKTDPEK